MADGSVALATPSAAAPSSPAPSAASTPSTPATPSTPVSTPATPAAPATPVTPAAPAAPLSAREELKAALSKVDLTAGAPPKPEAAKGPEAAVPPAEAAKAADGTQPETPAEAPAETLANPLDSIGPLPVETLTKALREKPELATALEAAGLPVETIEQTCRDAALTSQFLDVFPTPESAAFARENAEAMYGIDADFTGMQSVDDFGNFILTRMVPFDLERDEQGQPIPDPNNPRGFKSTGATARFMSLAGSYDTAQIGQAADLLMQQATASKNEELTEFATNLKAAADMIQEFREKGYKPSQQSGELTPEQKAREESLRTREEALKQQDQQAQQTQSEAFSGKLQDASIDGVLPDVTSLVKRSGLPAGVQEKAINEIFGEIAKDLEKDTSYKQQKKQDPRFRGNSENALKALSTFNVATMKGKMHAAAQRVLKTYGDLVIQRSTARQEKLATQTADSRMDPRAGVSTAKPIAPVKSRDDLYQEAETEVLAASGGQKSRDHNRNVLTKFYEKMGIGKSA